MASHKRKRLNSACDECTANTVGFLRAEGSSRVQVGNSYTEVHHEGRQVDDECLQDLRKTDPRIDKMRIENDKGGLMQGSCDWVLEDSNFQQWKQGKNDRLLWVKGDPGKGKTMILCGLIDELTKSQHTLSYFFCQATDSRINNATSVLRGLLYLLMVQDRSLIRHVRKRWDHGGESTFDPPNEWQTLLAILNDTLDNHSNPTYLVIDALDECDDDSLSLLLKLIVSTASRFHHIKWLVSSRNLPKIERGFGGPSWRLDISLEANAGPVSRAVADYISHKVGNLANLYSETEVREELQETMQEKANGTFLWAALVFDKLKAEEEKELENNRDILKVLDQVPKGLSDLYARMWTQIISMSENVELCKKILVTMFLAYRPLQLQELALLAGLKDNHAERETLVRLVRRCGSFLSVQQGTKTVHFVHQSAKDFLTDNKDAFDGMFPSGIEDGHHQLFSRSVEAMDSGLHQNIYGLPNEGVLKSEIEILGLDPLAAMRYSCVYWLDHFSEWVSLNRVGGQDGAKEVATFLQEKYLYWLEALGLCGNVIEGIASITKLEALATHNQWDSLAVLVLDAERFVLANRRGIEIAPLQVYVSALIFCPTSSWVRERFETMIPEWIKKKPKMQPEWDACLLTLQGHDSAVTHLAFSPDSRIMACSDCLGIIKIWDPHTGACLNTISGHKTRIVELAFLSGKSSTILASADEDDDCYSIKIWDPFNGSTPLRTFPMPNEMSDVVVLIAGSKTAVWADKAGTLIKLNLDTGTLLDTMELPAEPIAISPDGQAIVTYKEDEGCCQVWDWCNPKTARLTFSYDIYDEYVAVVSPDSTKLACVPSTYTYPGIDFRDLTTGVCSIYHLKDKLTAPRTLAFSTLGETLVSGNLNGTVELWDTTTATTQVLSGHGLDIEAVAISPDGSLLASACSDKSIKIWDLTVKAPLNSDSDTNQGGRDWLLSRNGLWVVAMISPSWIKIWSSATSECTFNLCEDMEELSNHHTELADMLEFSPCDGWLAFWSAGNFKIWETTTWKLQLHLKPQEQDGSRPCFALLGRNMVESFNGAIQIWDLHTGRVESMLSTSPYQITNMSFSPNGLWLASASTGGLDIWNWATKEHIWTQDAYPGEISWHPAHDDLLCTSSGDFDVSTGNYSTEKVQMQDKEDKAKVQITKDGDWIKVRGKPVLWVPPQNRPCRKTEFSGAMFEEMMVDSNESGIAMLDNCNGMIYVEFDVPKIVLNF